MLIHEEINNDNNRMEVGPGEYRKQVKCDRCGKVKPDGLEAILWYCNDYEKGFLVHINMNQKIIQAMSRLIIVQSV